MAALVNCQAILDGLEQRGYAVVDQAFAPHLLLQLQNYLASLTPEQFHTAGIGPGKAQTHRDIRSDQIHWLADEAPELGDYFAALEQLRQAVNQAFMLGLFEYEGHVAQYAPGSFYQKHWDAFRGQSNRRLSTILYLNRGWQPDDGGELVIYQEHNSDQIAEKVTPLYGRLVVFFSESFAHEVLPAKKLRTSVTGWFRVRGD